MVAGAWVVLYTADVGFHVNVEDADFLFSAPDLDLKIKVNIDKLTQNFQLSDFAKKIPGLSSQMQLSRTLRDLHNKLGMRNSIVHIYLVLKTVVSTILPL